METTREFKMAAVFCGSRKGNNPAYEEGAKQLAQELIKRKIGLVYGGGNIGIMGIVASTADEGGLPVVGIIPSALTQRETVGKMIGEAIYVDGMHERKVLMYKRADCFIALPGGFGTLDELIEITTWSQLGIHTKPIGLLNINGYFDGLLMWLKKAIEDGFVSEAESQLIIVDNDPASLLDKMAKAPTRPPRFQWNVQL